MNVIFSKGVLLEVNEARDYYEAEVEGLGDAFIQALYESIQEIKRFPMASRIIREPYHRFLMPRFPYGVIYRMEEKKIYIVAVAHLKRRPLYWTSREE